MTDPLQLQSSHEPIGATGRVKNDAYFTPPALASAAVGWLERDGYLWPRIHALEPSAGRGSWINAMARLQPTTMHALDIDPARTLELEALRCRPMLGDFETFDFDECGEPLDRYEAIIGNPPYNRAEAHVRRALALRDRFGVVAFLLRLAFLESQERVPFWREHPASKIYVLSERPSFSGGSTDNAAYGVFVWCTWHRGPSQVEVAQWKGIA